MTQPLLPQDNLLVEFTDTCMVHIKSRTNTGITVKTISFEDYCEALLAARVEIEVTGEAVDSPLCPQSPLVSTVQVRTLPTGSEWFFLTREAGLMDVHYGDTRFRQVGIPKLLFAVKWAKGKVVTVHVCAITDRIVTESTALYRYPFSNVMGGRICFGGNRLYEYDFEEPLRLHSLPDMFLSMPNNNDGYRNCNSSGLELRPFLELLEREAFPEDWLVPVNETFKQWRDSRAFY